MQVGAIVISWGKKNVESNLATQAFDWEYYLVKGDSNPGLGDTTVQSSWFLLAWPPASHEVGREHSMCETWMNHSIMDFSFNTNMVHVDHPVLLCLTVPPPQDIRKAILAIREFFIINKTAFNTTEK